MGARDERQLQRRSLARSVRARNHGERRREGRSAAVSHPALQRSGAQRLRYARHAVGRSAAAHRHRPASSRRGGPAHALGVEHARLRRRRGRGRRRGRRLRDAERARRRADARAPRVDPDPRERSGHATPGTPGHGDARRASRVARVPAPAARPLHLGRDARRSGTPRRDPRVPPRGGRPLVSGGRHVMALVKIPAEQRTLSDPEAIAAYLADRGIDYERWTCDPPVAAAAPASEVLAAYATKIDVLKAAGGYVTADVIDVTSATPGLEGMLARFNSEHWHDEDEVRLIVEGRGR